MDADKRLSLKNLNNRSLYESMNPSEEGPNGYPSEHVNGAEPGSLPWILSINKACDKFLESRGLRQPERQAQLRWRWKEREKKKDAASSISSGKD